MGVIAFKRILRISNRSQILKEDHHVYPFWSDEYRCWVLSTWHPAYIMRGQHHLSSVVQFAFRRALEIATGGLTLTKPLYQLDPDPMTFSKWVDDYLAVLQVDPTGTFLSYDIETPYKTGKGEDDLAKEDDEDYTILRCAFAYRPGEAVSIPWTASYMADLSRLFKSAGPKLGWNSALYDEPRVVYSLGHPLGGDQIDAMLAWHVLNSALDKRLGFVTPFYVQNTEMWKHLSTAEPAFYNAKDADMALQIWLGVSADLRTNNLWHVFDRHIVQLNRLLSYMSRTGVKLDLSLRQEAEDKLTALLVDLDEGMEAAVPTDARQLKLFAKPPKDTTGMIQVPGMRKTTKCPLCSKLDVKADHYKKVGVKKLKAGVTENPCVGLKSLKVALPSEQWAKPLPFKLSKLALIRYQRSLRHQAILNRDRKITFDEKAIMRLRKKYPDDPLYRLILEFRGVQKLRGTYVGITQPNGVVKGGMPVGKDGRVHATTTHNPSTLRTAMQDPNMQNLPRPQEGDALENMIRNMIIASPGHIFYARDFSGIEAKIVGYEALYPEYIRLCNLDVHSFYTAWALSQIRPGAIPTNDLPQLSWDDAKLGASLRWIKSEFGAERNNLYKHLVHGANFMQGAKGATDTILRMTGQEVPVSTVARVMNVYFELFPKIRKWHGLLLAQADKDGFLRNPFSYVHRFHSVYSWEKFGNTWQKEPGPQANQVIAFLPQSTAAGIIKEAMLRLWDNHFDAVGQHMRLLVHDEIFLEIPVDQLENVDRICKLEMERPILEMKMPADWNMGTHFVVSTEAKLGERWGLMKEIK